MVGDRMVDGSMVEDSTLVGSMVEDYTAEEVSIASMEATKNSNFSFHFFA